MSVHLLPYKEVQRDCGLRGERKGNERAAFLSLLPSSSRLLTSAGT